MPWGFATSVPRLHRLFWSNYSVCQLWLPRIFLLRLPWKGPSPSHVECLFLWTQRGPLIHLLPDQMDSHSLLRFVNAPCFCFAPFFVFVEPRHVVTTSNCGFLRCIWWVHWELNPQRDETSLWPPASALRLTGTDAGSRTPMEPKRIHALTARAACSFKWIEKNREITACQSNSSNRSHWDIHHPCLLIFLFSTSSSSRPSVCHVEWPGTLLPRPRRGCFFCSLLFCCGQHATAKQRTESTPNLVWSPNFRGTPCRHSAPSSLVSLASPQCRRLQINDVLTRCHRPAVLLVTIYSWLLKSVHIFLLISNQQSKGNCKRCPSLVVHTAVNSLFTALWTTKERTKAKFSLFIGKHSVYCLFIDEHSVYCLSVHWQSYSAIVSVGTTDSVIFAAADVLADQ